MTTRCGGVLFALLIVMLVGAGPARADGHGGTTDDGFWVKDIRDGRGGQDSQGGRGPEPLNTPQLLPPSATCGSAAEVTENDLGTDVNYCAESHTTTRTVTAADVQKAFAELKLDPGTLVVQPPDGLTLVNFKTNFYTTTTTPTTLTVTLLDQPVTIEATPATYTWHFGDGQTTSTTHPGAPYPKLTITHNYQLKGDYLPSLSTTYTGRYKIADGPWQTIPGTVTIDGPGQPLRAIEAKPKLVGY